MTGRDEYYNRAKQEGYRARSAYKLKQLDETAGLLGQGRTVLDLGAAPGGWLQVAAERVGTDGVVIGVDRQRIDDLEDPDPRVELIRGDMTDDATRDEVRDVVGADGDERPVDVVISDMAPNMTGEYDLDHARSVHLARQAFEVATDVLATGGDVAVKVFDGQDLEDLEADIDAEFEYVRQVRPKASRDSSSELYLVAKGFLTAPVREGDQLEVDIEDVGSEGDGIAKVDGYTLFVSGTGTGDTVEVRVDDVKPNYGFAQPLQ
ncbi:23S rRNA (uridine(2552)-2'-O)-methyltransferase [Halobacteriales archaeon QS_4_62_28]|nr:MAG: 23S rRNA (uridine(2552)-2'-O)-methyltransferase [Halobacteriales archaeon QS_4_62_28]